MRHSLLPLPRVPTQNLPLAGEALALQFSEKRMPSGETPSSWLNICVYFSPHTLPFHQPGAQPVLSHPTPRNLTLTTGPANTHLSPLECLSFRIDTKANTTQKTESQPSHWTTTRFSSSYFSSVSFSHTRAFRKDSLHDAYTQHCLASFYCSTTNTLPEVNGAVCTCPWARSVPGGPPSLTGLAFLKPGFTDHSVSWPLRDCCFPAAESSESCTSSCPGDPARLMTTLGTRILSAPCILSEPPQWRWFTGP